MNLLRNCAALANDYTPLSADYAAQENFKIVKKDKIYSKT